jgi:hypothetical protein
MKYQVILPSTESIDPTVDFFIMHEHMPDVNFLSGPESGQSLDDARINYFGKNTMIDMFTNHGLNYEDYFFIFEGYLNLHNFEGYWYPRCLITVATNYKMYSPDFKIDFAQKQYSVNCAMNKIRDSRLLASCWFSNNKIDRLLHTQSWSSSDSTVISRLDELLQLGNLIDWTHNFGPDVKMLDQHWIDHCGNLSTDYGKNEENFFNSEIKTIFNTTAISVVLEPVFWEHGSMVTEKYMHAIYGGTIPLVSGYKIYDSLSTLGFDTFSDIIDISSQYELDPVLRIWNMLEKNKNVFLQWQDIISDLSVQNRIINNLTLLQNPTQIIKNSILLNSKKSYNTMILLKDKLALDKEWFLYFDMLNITDKTNK